MFVHESTRRRCVTFKFKHRTYSFYAADSLSSCRYNWRSDICWSWTLFFLFFYLDLTSLFLQQHLFLSLFFFNFSNLFAHFLSFFLFTCIDIVSIDYIYLHLQFGSPYLLLKYDIGFGLIQKLISLETTNTRNYLRTIFTNIIYLKNSFERTIFLESLGIKSIDLKLDGCIKSWTFSSLITQLDENRLAIIWFNFRVRFDF